MDYPEEEEEDDDRAPMTVVPGPAAFDSSPVQESPFSNYLNNLSPINPAKAANMGQVFHGINSSPLVFASPTVSLQPRKGHSKRNRMFDTPNVDHSQDVRRDDPTYSSHTSKEFVTLSGSASDDVDKEFSDSKDTLRVRSSSASQIADGFLADPFEVDCANSTCLRGRHSNCSKSISELDCEGDSTKGFGREGTDLQQHVTPEQSSLDADKSFTCDGSTVGAEEYHETGPSFSVRCDVAAGNLSVDDGENQVDIDPVSGIKEGSHVGAFSSHVQPPYDPLQDSEANENRVQGAPESLRLFDVMQHREVMQQQRFLLRRCLRFDDMLLDVSSNSLGQRSNNVNCPGSLAMEEVENLDLSEVTSSYINTSASTVKAAITGQDGKRSAMTTNKPSGIGLHLNSIVGARSILKRDKDTQGGRGLKPAGAGTGNLLGKPTEFPQSVDSRKFTKAEELYGTPLDKRTLSLGFAEAEFTRKNAKRRRMASNASDGDGCKRCSCKKSRCLKLYCDCFAAGLFCTEPCACQGCLNIFEEQDSVLAARELIESRNPMAFAPKIVHANKEVDATIGEDGVLSTPSSARHKKGCNCKRSMCQKKYCECYQVNVGCSDNCRCEGCRNVFGTKEDFFVARELACSTIDEASLEVMNNIKPAMAARYSRDHIMPPTPSFQFSDNRKGLQRSRLAIECLSPNSSAKSGAVGWTREMQSEGSKESPTLMTFTEFIDPDFGEKVDEFSPKHDSLGSSSNLAPLLSPPATVKSSSESSKAELTLLTTRLGGGHPPSRFLFRGGSIETPGIGSGGENSRQDHKPGSKVNENLDDDAPGASKDVPSPTRPVIVSSPSRKRVSSPHKQVHDRRLTSSTALRSGGKFILKAVSSFPLTTHAEPRNDTSEPTGPPFSKRQNAIHIRSDPAAGMAADKPIIIAHVNSE